MEENNRPLPVRSYGLYPQAIPDALTYNALHGSDNTPEIGLMDYWRVIIARRWTVLAILFTSLIVTLIWTLKQVPIYQATATVQIDRTNPNVLNFRGVYEIESATDDALRTQFEVLRSRTLARRVIESLKLGQRAEFKAQPPSLVASYRKALSDLLSPPRPVEPGEPDNLRPLIDSYVTNLKIQQVRQSRLVTISFESENPSLAAAIINSHAANYIDQNLLFKWEASLQASKFLEDQLTNQKANLEKARDRLQAYSEQKDIRFTGEGKNTAEEKLKQLEEALTKARADRFSKQAYYDELHDKSKVPDVVQITNDSLIASLTNQLADLKKDQASLTVQLGPEMDQVKSVKRKIEETERSLEEQKKRVIGKIDTEYLIAVRNEDFLEKAVNKQTEIVVKINQELTQYEIMKSEVKTTEEMYSGLLNRSKEAAVSAGLNASNIRIVDRAEIPTAPVRPKKSVNLMFGFALGLVFGVGLALFQNYLDDTFKTTADVNRFLNTPVLGVVPRLDSVTGRHGYGYGKSAVASGYGGSLTPRSRIELTTHEAQSSVIAEAYRSIRTSLLLSSPDRPPKTIVVSSSLPSEGKTVSAINMAISLTQAGSRVVLVDADMRKPRIHTVLAVDSKIGLSSFLAGAATLRDVIQECQVPNLFVIPCGVLPPNPAELILSARFNQLLDVLREYFDYVVIDTPPLNSVSDARVLGTICDCVTMVIKASSTSRSQVRQAFDHLLQTQARIAGVILNDVDVRKRSYYSSQYYYGGVYSDKTG
jgi:succinoglycan biosynthesis transport protein ExoP